jgi:hypothetical protein
MPHETILCATCPPAGNSQLGAGALSVCDLQTGSVLASFKQTSASARGVAVVDTDASTAEGGLLFAAQAEKAVLQVYNFQKVSECSTLSYQESELELRPSRTRSRRRSCCLKRSRASLLTAEATTLRQALLKDGYICGRCVMLVLLYFMILTSVVRRLHLASCSMHGTRITVASASFASPPTVLPCSQAATTLV